MAIDAKILSKYDALKAWLSRRERAVVAFSGGVDSTLLLYAAKEAGLKKLLAVTVVSPLLPEGEQHEAEAFCASQGVTRAVLQFDPFSVEGFRENPKDRCYHCKKHIFENIRALAEREGIECVCEGSNADDVSDYRPGMRAIRELGICSPLLEVGLSKTEIRALLNGFGLPCGNKPSLACLASRIPYGDAITEEKLIMADKAEQLLFSLGFSQCRVRIHGNIARIEVLPEDIPRFLDEGIRSGVDSVFKKLGFAYVTLDLKGYRTGSLNEVLDFTGK